MNIDAKEERWVELSVRIPDALVSSVKEFLENLGSVGIVEDSLVEKGEPDTACPIIKGYLCGSLKAASEDVAVFRKFVASLSELFPDGMVGEVETTETGADDWQRWKEHFKPIKVSPRIVIKPTWEPYTPEGGEVIVDIDPGMAFGTGSHETTRLCCMLLDKTIAGGEDLLDVGTGTGILAIAASKLGAGNIDAIDIDEPSVVISKENAELNGVLSKMQISSTPLEKLSGFYNIVVANILAEPLITMSGDVSARLHKGGYLILSGILKEKADSVVGAYLTEGLKLEERLEEGDWAALLFKK